MTSPENVLATMRPIVSPGSRSLPKRCLYVRSSGTVKASHHRPVITKLICVKNIVESWPSTSGPASAGPANMRARHAMNGTVEPT